MPDVQELRKDYGNSGLTNWITVYIEHGKSGFGNVRDFGMPTAYPSWGPICVSEQSYSLLSKFSLYPPGQFSDNRLSSYKVHPNPSYSVHCER
jgi:hypothetical protein